MDLEKLFSHHTYLQGVANQLGLDMHKVISASESELAKLITDELRLLVKKNRTTALKKLKELEKKIGELRASGFTEAMGITYDIAKEIAVTASITFAEAGIKKKLSETQIKNILDYEPHDGQSIAQWFDGYRRADLSRIVQSVQGGFINGHTIETIIKDVRHATATTRDRGRMIARTVLNGTANATRMEVFEENADVLDGVKYIATFDSRVCSVCGYYDGKIWKPSEVQARPPLHPNCRCVLVPYIDVGEEGKRPAENADFEQMAKEAYSANPNARKSWDELSYDTRKKYRYDAMKNWTDKTGRSAYRNVSADQTFSDFFEKQPKSFQRSWLGPTRYDLFSSGKLTLDQIITPDNGFTRTIDDLKKLK